MSSTQARTNAEDTSEHSPYLGVEDLSETSFSTASDLAGALRRTAAAHCEHEIRASHADAKWPEWYAEYMTREQSRTEFPT